MNSEIEQRIVAMYFDNKDFEKNAKQTIDTLSELKENLNLEDSVRGFDELDKAGKKLNLSQARTTVRNLKDAVGGLGEGLKKAFNIGTAPIHALDNFFNTFRGYVSKFIGFDLASKFVNSLESALRQLTVAPIEAGWSMYQANVDSTKTIMSGTLKSYKEQMSKVNADWTYDEGEHMEYVKEHLAELSSYAQKTVFSLSDMTSNVGKFTNNNIDLETSVNAMEGIANMAAKAGQGAQQASMAMYNFSQALGVGKMTSIDWKSIENANMATTELKDLFIQTAEAAGKLTKEVTKTNDGKEIEKFFITMDKNGKKLARNKWIEVSAENFRDSLSNGWLDKDTMLKVMQIYSGKVRDLDTLAAMGFDINDTELVEQLFAIGEEAEKAATQVRTFQKMWDAMTESVQSGWADSMQYIFGDMLEATDFWTTVNDKIGEVLDNSAERRNNLLREWRGLTFNKETGEWVRLEGAVDGREDLIQGIYGVIDAAKSLGSAFSSAWSDVFGNMTGSKLQAITKGFRDFIDRFKGWLGDLNDTNSRLSKIRKAVSGVFSVLKIGITILKAVFNLGVQIIKPFIDPLLNLFSKFGEKLNLSGAKNLGEMLTMLRDRFAGLWNKLSEMGLGGIFSKIGEKLGNLWNSIKEGVGNFLDENGLSGVKEWFIQLGDKIEEGYETVKTWWQGSGIPAFFERMWKAIVGLFTPTEKTGYFGGSTLETRVEDAPIVSFFKNAWEGLKSFFEEVKGWGIWTEIGDFFSGIWETLSGLFTPTEKTGYFGGSTLETRVEDAPIIAFFKNVWGTLRDFFEEVKGWGIWTEIGNFFSGIWETLSGLFTPTEKTGYFGGSTLETRVEDAPIVSFFKNAWEGLKSFFEEVKGWGIWTEIGNFFSGIWDSVSGLFKPTEKTGYFGGSTLETRVEDAPIVAFFKDTWDKIRSTFEEVKGWGIWSEIGSFFTGIWDTIMSFFNGSGEAVETVGETAEELTDNTPVSAEATVESVGLIERIISAISGFVTSVMESINGVVIPPEVSEFFVNLGDVLKGVFGVISDLLGVVGRILNGGMTAEDWHLLIGVIAAFLTDKVYKLLNNKYLSGIQTQAESFASKFMALGIGMLAIAAALSLLTTIDQSKMWSAAGALAGLMLVMGFVVNQLTKKTQAKTALTNAIGQTPTERIITKLIGALEKVGMVAVAMALLPDIIKAFGEAKKMAPELSGLDILETLTGLVVFISGVSLGLALVDKISGNMGLDPIAALKTSASIVAFLAVLTAGILAIAGVLDGIFGTENVVSTLEQGGQILGTLGGALSSLIGGLVGGFAKGFNLVMGGMTEEEKLDKSMEILEKLGDKLEIFTSDKTAGISRILNLVGLLSQTMDDVPKASDFTKFTESLEPLATSIMRFSLILSGFTLEENAEKIPLDAMKDRVMALIEIMRAFDIPDFSTIVSSGQNKAKYFIEGIDYLSENMTPERFAALGSFMANLTTAFNEAMDPEGDAMKTMSGDLMKNLSAAIRIGLGDSGKYEVGAFDALPIIDSITTALGYGETAIATAVHNMVQAGIDAQSGKKLELNSDLLSGITENNLMGELVNAAMNGEETSQTTDEIVGKLSSMLYGNGGSKDNPKEDSLMGMMTGFQSDIDGIEFPDMGEKLSKAFSFKDAETGEDLDLTAKLNETLGEFEKTLNEETEFQIKIVPTFDLSNLNEESLRAALGDYPVGLPLQFSMPDLLQVDFTGMASELNMDDIRSRITDVTVAVNNNGAATVVAINHMGDRINNLESAIRQLKLYLDTGALVGGITPMIDKALGRRANWADSGGIPIDSFVNPYAK